MMFELPLPKRRRVELKKRANGFVSNPTNGVGENSLEDQYAERRRKTQKPQIKHTKLPLKDEDGWRGQELELDQDSDSDEQNGLDDDAPNQLSTDLDDLQQEREPELPVEEQITRAKEELARAAEIINEDPEENVAQLKKLAQVADTKVAVIKQFALAAQLAIYKDIIPGYRIRPISETEDKVKVSKQVRKLRNFEQSLVSAYRDYVRTLAQCASGSKSFSKQDSAQITSLALFCVAGLLDAVPHFNFRSELLQVVLSKVGKSTVDRDYVTCITALHTVFERDEDGKASLEAVSLITKMMKSKEFRIPDLLLNTFLHLRLLSEFSGKASANAVETPETEGKKSKVLKQKKEFRSKRLRKEIREEKAITEEMREADAAVAHEERYRNQAEMLKMVFATYFRILKSRNYRLTGAVLEGLARYAHLINQDFFGDILEALKDLIKQTDNRVEDEDDTEDEADTTVTIAHRNSMRESLLCITTAFALLQGQDGSDVTSALHLDLGAFVTQLYWIIQPACMDPNIESQPLSIRNSSTSPNKNSTSEFRVNVRTTIVLLIRSISSALTPQVALRAVPPVRVAAFCHQLMAASLHLPEKSCLAMMGLMHKITKLQGRKVARLWYSEDRVGDGRFDPFRGALEGSNPFAATVWEGELLKLHFCPAVREAAKRLEKNVVEARAT